AGGSAPPPRACPLRACPVPPRERVPGRDAARVSDAAGRSQPVHRQLPVREADPGSVPGHVSVFADIAGVCDHHYVLAAVVALAGRMSAVEQEGEMSKRSGVARFLGAVWTGVDGVRKVLHLVLLLFIFSIVLVAMSASAPKLPGQAALVIRPAGNLVEQLEGDPYERAVAEAFGQARPETLVKDIVDGLAYAKDDPRIKAVVIYLDDLGSAGLSKLQRIGGALADFRESGKPVIAAADNFG